ncbi:MAG: hypothetical protein M9949_06040 [Candidatus Kapabacteria bacterium]|nr:hypothetical protein [Candidatus Kapabacteria bacterium]
MIKDKNTLSKEFGERLEDWMRPNWERQKDFATYITETYDKHYSPATINSYCKGRSFPDQVFLYIIHDLGADLNAMITGKNVEPTYHSSSMPHVQRLNRWIAKYCGTYDDLFNMHKTLIDRMQLDTADIFAYAYGTLSYSPKVSDFFKAIGCNMHWVMTGTGTELVSSQSKTEPGKPLASNPNPESPLDSDAIIDAAADKILSDPELSDKLSKQILEKLVSNLSKKDK